MNVTHAHSVHTFALTFDEPVLLAFRDEPRLFAESVTVSVKIAEGALTLVGTTFDAKGFAVSKSGQISKRRSSWQGANLAVLPDEARDAIKAALIEVVGPVSDERGQLDGFSRTNR